MDKANTILITGANGFVGSQLTRELLGAGYNVRITSRFSLNKERFESRLSCFQTASIDATTDWSAVLWGVDCVVHLAARVHVMSLSAHDRCSFYETNVLGTKALAAAAAKSGVRRFVFLSSVKVNGEATFGKPYLATDICAPEDEYGKSKFQAEQALFDLASNATMSVVAIRSPLVYGPNVRANFLRLLSLVYRGIPLPFGAVDNARSLISIWNLCDFIRHVIEAPVMKSDVLMVSDGVSLSTPDLIRLLASAMGRSARLVPVPVKLLRIVGAMSGKSAEVDRLCNSLVVDIADTTRQFGWTPPVSINEGIARTVKWYLGEVNLRRD